MATADNRWALVVSKSHVKDVAQQSLYAFNNISKVDMSLDGRLTIISKYQL